MTMRQIKEKIDNTVYKAIGEASRDWEGYGEASFPVRLTQRQVEEISDFLNNELSIESWDKDEIKIDPKAVYLLWIGRVGILRHEETYWGIRKISPDTEEDDNEYNTAERSIRRRLRERRDNLPSIFPDLHY